MACQFEFILPAGRFERAAETALAALDLVDELEAQLTAYRDTSELASINRLAADGPVPVDPRLFGLFELALDLHQRTAGAYDITSGPLSKVWGFYRRQGAVPDPAALVAALEHVGSRYLKLDSSNLTIRFLSPGIELNLGSIGKGYALDRCAEMFLAAGISSALLHGGQSSVLALGDGAAGDNKLPTELPSLQPGGLSRGEDRHVPQTTCEPGWTIGIGDPLRPGKRLALVRLNNRALGTSGSSAQFFRQGGKRYGHILDPRTGWPAEGLSSATILAASAAAADAYSTAAYVLGLDGALALCEREGVAGIFVEPARAGTKQTIHTAGLRPEEFRLLD